MLSQSKCKMLHFQLPITHIFSVLLYLRFVIVLLDNYDSFTYILRDYFMQLHEEVLVLRNDQCSAQEIMDLRPMGIVISPGPGTPSTSGITMDLLNAALGKIPVLGVCLGMQAIAEHYGNELHRAEYPMHGKLSAISLSDHPMFEGLGSSLMVCRYHSLVVQLNEDSAVKTCAQTDLGEVMALSDQDGDAWGVQFHPEAILSEGGMSILANWLKHINLRMLERA